MDSWCFLWIYCRKIKITNKTFAKLTHCMNKGEGFFISNELLMLGGVVGIYSKIETKTKLKTKTKLQRNKPHNTEHFNEQKRKQFFVFFFSFLFCFFCWCWWCRCCCYQHLFANERFDKWIAKIIKMGVGGKRHKGR